MILDRIAPSSIIYQRLVSHELINQIREERKIVGQTNCVKIN